MTVSETQIEIGAKALDPEAWTTIQLTLSHSKTLLHRRERAKAIAQTVLTAALSDQVVGWRTDFDNAPSPCLGWCKPPSGDVARVIYRGVWRGLPHWSSHGSEITVVGWQPLPAIELAAPASTSGEV